MPDNTCLDIFPLLKLPLLDLLKASLPSKDELGSLLNTPSGCGGVFLMSFHASGAEIRRSLLIHARFPGNRSRVSRPFFRVRTPNFFAVLPLLSPPDPG